MEGWIFVGVVAVAFSVIMVLALCKVSGDCSRQEEREEMERMKDGK